jgi:hypothetical protein
MIPITDFERFYLRLTPLANLRKAEIEFLNFYPKKMLDRPVASD